MNTAARQILGSRLASPARILASTLALWSVMLPDGLWTQGTTITRASADAFGVRANSQSVRAAISADGRFVTFHSRASDLVAGDTNGVADVFVHDQVTGATSRVSVDSRGAQGNHDSRVPVISADGRFVAFASEASNLVPNDTNVWEDVFVHDRVGGTTTRVSVDSRGAQGNWFSSAAAISADGRFVVFESSASNLVATDSNGKTDVFVHDRVAGTTSRVSVDSRGVQGNDFSYGGTVSGEGRFVAFPSDASNLVGGDTNGTADVFVHDRVTRTTSRVSVDSRGVQGNDPSNSAAISADGRFVVFESLASNLVPGRINGGRHAFLHDRLNGTTTRLSVDPFAVPRRYSHTSGGPDRCGSTDPDCVRVRIARQRSGPEWSFGAPCCKLDRLCSPRS